MSEKKATRFYYGYIIVIISMLIAALAWGGQRTFGVFLEHFLSDFDWTRASASLTITIQGITTAFTSIIAGRLSDRFGPRIVLTICGILIGSGYLLSYFVSSLWQLYLFQGILVGIGLAGIMVPLTSMVIRWFSYRAGLMNGLVHSGLGIGIAIIPPLSTWLIIQTSWQEAYLWLGIAILVLIAGFSQFLKRPPLTLPNVDNRKITRTIINTRSYSFVEALKNRAFWILSLLFFVDVFSLNIIMVHIVIHAEDLQITSTVAATILSLTAAVSIIGRIGAGALSDKIGIRGTVGIGLSVILLSLVWLLFATELWMLYVFAAVFGLGGWCVGAVMSPFVAENFGLKSHGIILGTVSFAGNLGGAIGPLVAGYIFDTMDSYDLAFIICIILTVMGIVSLKFLKKPEGMTE